MQMKTTDLALQENIAEELSFDPKVDAGRIGVAVKDGIVTLTGRVDTYAEKIGAENAAKRVAGVKGLACELEVELPAFHQRTDADIVAAALNILAWDVSVPRDAVLVQADHGWLTLGGTVDWQYQKESAEDAIRNLAGVRGATNHVAVRPRPSVTTVKQKLRDVFERRACIDANSLTVDAHDSVVTLRGTVHSWAERDDATRAAFSVPGVARVENLTTVG
jgi:osmotically-inducible protein OsmY